MAPTAVTPGGSQGAVIRVLFLCVENAGRSQMAEAIARQLGGGWIEAISAGSAPANSVNPGAVEALKEIGLDIGGQRSIPSVRSAAGRVGGRQPKGLESVDWSAVDYAITLCDEEICPVTPPGVRREHWPLPDPKGRPIEAFCTVREVLRERLTAFLQAIQ